jgi:hypothetical protein
MRKGFGGPGMKKKEKETIKEQVHKKPTATALSPFPARD